MKKEFSELNGYEVKDATARAEIEEIKAALEVGGQFKLREIPLTSAAPIGAPENVFMFNFQNDEEIYKRFYMVEFVNRGYDGGVTPPLSYSEPVFITEYIANEVIYFKFSNTYVPEEYQNTVSLQPGSGQCYVYLPSSYTESGQYYIRLWTIEN